MIWPPPDFIRKRIVLAIVLPPTQVANFPICTGIERGIPAAGTDVAAFPPAHLNKVFKPLPAIRQELIHGSNSADAKAENQGAFRTG